MVDEKRSKVGVMVKFWIEPQETWVTLLTQTQALALNNLTVFSVPCMQKAIAIVKHMGICRDNFLVNSSDSWKRACLR